MMVSNGLYGAFIKCRFWIIKHWTLEVGVLFRECLVNCNRRCNVIVIHIVLLFFNLIIFLLQGIIISYK